MMNNRIIPFSRFNSWGLLLSIGITTILLIFTFLSSKGFNFGIDFSSGQSINIEVKENVSIEEIEGYFQSSFEKISVSRFGNTSENQFNIKIDSTTENKEEQFQKFTQVLDENIEYELLSSAFIGSTISQNLLNNSAIIVSVALFLMLLYIWLRFKLQFAISAICALIHDALFIIACIGAFRIEITVSTVAAVLTIIGYSINDTIVIFDRIRENNVVMKDSPFTQITDTSITKTLTRTIITSLTTLLAVVSIFIFAIGDIRNFALVLIIGVIEGAWSSIFIATPLLYFFGFHKKLVATGAEPASRQGLETAAQGVLPNTNASAISSGTTGTTGTASSVSISSGEEKKQVAQSYIDKVRQELELKKRKKHR